MVQLKPLLTDPLFSRGGRLLTDADEARILTVNGRSKAVFSERRNCSRCGGAGRSNAWAHTGYTCYQCGGSGGHYTVTQPAYTEAQLQRLNAAQATRQAAKQAEAQRLQAEQDAKDLAAFKEWLPTTDMDMILWLGEQSESTFNFLKDMAIRVNTFRTLSPAQYEAVVKCYANAKARDRKATESQYLAEIGERLTDVKVRLTHIFDYSSPEGQYPVIIKYKHILETEDGQTVIYTGNARNFPGEVSDTYFLVSGKVKDHKVYNGVKQTVIERPTVAPVTAPDL